MIVVDTSALMAIALREPEARACMAALEAADSVLISAATMTEALIVAAGKNARAQLAAVIDDLDMEVIPVTGETAKRVADAYARWGRGHHRAALNFGDCFAYEVAMAHRCPLLYVGRDFAKTDVASVLT